MKKFFTLIAVALVAISASAQETVLKTYIDASFDRKSNGDPDLMAPFKSVEFVTDEATKEAMGKQHQARVVKDPADIDLSDRLAKWCIEVINEETRVVDIDPDTGEPKKDWQGNIQYTGTDWDAQFFITLPEGIKVEAGTKMTFSMMVKAENATTTNAATQAHDGPGGYKHYEMVGTIPFTTEWTEYSGEFTVASEADGCNTIAINLACEKNPNKYYFKDIKWSIPVPKVYEWKEIFASDGTDGTPFSVKYFKNYTAAKSVDGAIVVPSLDPEKTYAEYYMEDDKGNAVDAILANDWDTQFLIPLGTDLVGGKKFKITFKYKADKAASVGAQVHMAPPAVGAIESKGLGEYPEYGGTYIHYQLWSGDANTLNFTEEWQTYNEDLSTVTSVPSQATEEKPMGSVCFNLNPKVNNEFISNTFYFDDIKVYVDEEDVPTAINTTKAVKATNAIYNVAGQQMKSLQKGLNIVNGEKVYVK